MQKMNWMVCFGGKCVKHFEVLMSKWLIIDLKTIEIIATGLALIFVLTVAMWKKSYMFHETARKILYS